MTQAIACSVGNAEARKDVHRASLRLGVPTLDVSMPLHRPRGRAVWAGLVYDLDPWTNTSVEMVQRARHEYPALPILLVVPSRKTAADLLRQCLGLPCLHGVIQGRKDSPEEIWRAMHVLLADAPATAVRQVVLALLPGLPEFIAYYIERVVDGLRQRREAVRVGSLIGRGPLSPRAAERMFERAHLPSPKRVADWLTLLLIALAAERGGITLGVAARRFGYDPNQFYRLRQRVLPPKVRDLPARATQAFDITLLAFAETCGVPRDRALAALELDPSGRRQALA